MTSSEKNEQIETLIAFCKEIATLSESNLTAMNEAYFDKNIINTIENAREVNTMSYKQNRMETIEPAEDATFEDTYEVVKERAKVLKERAIEQSQNVKKRIDDEQKILEFYAEVEAQYFNSKVLLEDCSTLVSRFKERPAPDTGLEL